MDSINAFVSGFIVGLGYFYNPLIIIIGMPLLQIGCHMIKKAFANHLPVIAGSVPK
jgi:hypothetical protein